MRTHVTFRHPAEFVPFSDEDGILCVKGAEWFAAILRRVPGLEIENDFCQEDWGVVFFTRRNKKQFWIGLSFWDEGEWIAHFHHGSFAFFQWFSTSANNELKRLLSDAHHELILEQAITDIAWYEEKDMNKAKPMSFSTPLEQ